MIRKKIFLSSMFALIIGLIGFQAEAQIFGGQDDGNKIKGEVTDASSGQGLSDIEVTVEGTDASATSEDDGTFSIEDVEPGTHTVRVEADGYEEFTREVQISEEGEAEDLNIDLQPVDGGMQSPMDQPQDQTDPQQSPDDQQSPMDQDEPDTQTYPESPDDQESPGDQPDDDVQSPGDQPDDLQSPGDRQPGDQQTPDDQTEPATPPR